MADNQRTPTGSNFRVCLNGLAVREPLTESDAIGAAIDLKRLLPSARVTIVNVRTGLTVEVAPNRPAGPSDSGES